MVQVAIAGETVELNNLDKVLYPETGFTKGDMIRYYEAISPIMLPHLAHHPVTVKRYPNGVAGLFFYEKRCPEKRPTWVDTATVASERHGSITFCVIDNAPTLVWMANRAAIEFHTYLYRKAQENRPTMLVFDLDPGEPATLHDCLEIGANVRDLLLHLGLKSFAKTSGGKGLHIGVPVTGASFAEVKSFAHGLADLMAQEQPKRVTSVMAKAQRTGKVFIDWSQNDHGKTTACAYTLRARARPSVSTPVSWEEVERARRRRKASALAFTPHDVIQRVNEFGDLFAPTLTLRQRLPSLPAIR